MSQTGSLLTVNLNVDVEGVLSSAREKLLKAFGRDVTSVEFKSWFDEHTRLAFLAARDVQCIGMPKPVLISDIYQPTRLVREKPLTFRSPRERREWEFVESEGITFEKLLTNPENSIITAGPGWGKTTFLHWMFLKFLLRRDDRFIPFLVTLRQKDAIKDLDRIVSEAGKSRPGGSGQILLLVDGYDEIPMEHRKQVSDLLMKFSVRNLGRYLLTCREYYQVYEVKVARLKIGEFGFEDQVRFVQGFLRAYGATVDPAQIVQDLHERGFADLIRHPLLLTLAALVRSRSSDFRARNVVTLIQAALSTLSFHWDQEKGLARESMTPLDGAAHLKLLKRLAFALDLDLVDEHRPIGVVRKQLESMKWEDTDPLKVLMEMARFYGIFVPVAERWGFVHKSLKDFLAAQYWVETGGFAQDLAKGTLRFDSRVAFAACLVDDATRIMELALEREEGLPVFVEMLVNDPSFKHDRIAQAIINYYERYKGEHYYVRTREKIECALEQEFINEASSKFLDYVVQACAAANGKTADTLAAYAIVELSKRAVPLSREAFESSRKKYTLDGFVFDVRNRSHLRFCEVRHI